MTTLVEDFTHVTIHIKRYFGSKKRGLLVISISAQTGYHCYYDHVIIL